MKLQLKTTVVPFKLADQVVLQFNGQYAKLPDPTGAMWTLTRGLDGSKGREALVEHVMVSHPAADRSSVHSALDDFIQNRLVELPEQALDTTLSTNEKVRWSRNLDFFGSIAAYGENKYLYQEALRSKKICVLGCGGLGTHILFELVALGVKYLTLLDFDKIELSNLNRQILYKEEDIGTEKVTTAKRRLLEFNSDLQITTHSKLLASTDDVAHVIQGHDLVICIADKPANAIGDWLNAACVHHTIPFITGGVDIRRAVFYSVHPGVSGCEACWLSSARAKSALVEKVSIQIKEQNVGYERQGPAFVPLVAVAAGMMVSEAVKYLTACQPAQLQNKLKEFTFDDLSVNVAETWTRDPHCRVCGVSA